MAELDDRATCFRLGAILENSTQSLEEQLLRLGTLVKGREVRSLSLKEAVGTQENFDLVREIGKVHLWAGHYTLYAKGIDSCGNDPLREAIRDAMSSISHWSLSTIPSEEQVQEAASKVRWVHYVLTE